MPLSIDGPDPRTFQLFRRAALGEKLSAQTPVRAALLSPGLAMGGAERWLVSLVRYSDPELLNWTGVAISSLGGTDRYLCEELRQHTSLHCQERDPSRKNPNRPFHRGFFEGNIHPTWADAVAAVCKEADVVVAWGGVFSIGHWVKNLEIPAVIVSHTTRQEDELHPLTGVTHLAAVSEAAAGYFDGREGREQYGDVRVVFNGADLNRCIPQIGRNAQRREWGISDGGVAVGYVGRESPEKNFLAAAEAVLAMEPRFQAVYHSSLVQQPDGHAPELNALAERHPDRILLNPTRPEIGDILAGLDVLALASHREAFSLALIEAWLARVPVVATPVGSLPELQKKFGMKLAIEVPMNPSAAQMASAIRRAAGPQGRAIAQRAHKMAMKQFTCEAMADNWTQYLREIVSEDQPAGIDSLASKLGALFRKTLSQNSGGLRCGVCGRSDAAKQSDPANLS